MKKITGTIKSYDILGEPFSLNYEESNQYSTCPGGILSCCAVSLATLAFAMLAYQFVDTKNPNVAVTVENSSVYPKFDLWDDYFSPAFAISHFDRVRDQKVPYENFVTIRALFKNQTLDQTTNPVTFVNNIEIIPFKNCSHVHPHLLEAYQDSQINFWITQNSFCIDITDPKMYNIFKRDIDMPYRELEISIYPCSVANPADCQPESAFEDMGLWYSSAGRTIDFSDKKNPIGL